MKMVTLEVIQKQKSPIGWPMIHQPIPKGPNSLSFQSFGTRLLMTRHKAVPPCSL